MGVKCVHIENRLFSELRITYCVRAGETATFQLSYRRDNSRFQTGFTLDAQRDFWPRLCQSGLSCTNGRGMLNALPFRYMSAGLLRYWCHDPLGILAGSVAKF